MPESGLVPVTHSLKTTWTSQIVVLADFHNLRALDPGFVDQLTAGHARYQNRPAAMDSFHKLLELTEKDLINKDGQDVIFRQAPEHLASGETKHVAALCYAVAAISVDISKAMETIGFFPIPPREAVDPPGMTLWMPLGLYIPKSSPIKALARRFLQFALKTKNCSASNRRKRIAGPHVVAECSSNTKLNRSVRGVNEIYGYSNVTSAQEFLSPL